MATVTCFVDSFEPWPPRSRPGVVGLLRPVGPGKPTPPCSSRRRPSVVRASPVERRPRDTVRIAALAVMRSAVALRLLALCLVALGVVSLDVCAGASVGAGALAAAG